MNHLDQDVDVPNTENPSDEADILSDQDETVEANIVSDGTELKGPDDFARGEIDVKEQMDRTMAKMDADNHRPTNTPH